MKLRAAVFLLGVLAASSAMAQTGAGWVSGSVRDPSGLPVVGATVQADSPQGQHLAAATEATERFLSICRQTVVTPYA